MSSRHSLLRHGPIVLLEPEINSITARLGLAAVANYPPLAQARLAGQIDDPRVQIVDFRIPGEKRRFYRQIRSEAPAVVGISTTFSSNGEEAKEVARKVREISPDTVILLGGNAPSEEPDAFFDAPIDFIGHRNGDVALPQLIYNLRNTGEVPEQAPGFYHRHGDRWQMGPAVPALKISQLRRYAWQLLPRRYWKNYYQAFLTMGMTQTSEGCPYDCNFCSVWITHGRRIDIASLDNVKHDFESLPRFVTGMFFADDIWMQGSETQIRNLYDPLLEWLVDDYFPRRGTLKLTTETRTDLFLRERDRFRDWTERGGLQRIFFGVEAVTDEQLKGYSKRNTIDHNSEAIRVAAEMGLHVTAQLVIQCDADREYFDEILRFYEAHRPWIRSMNYTVATPLPGTVLYTEVLRHYPELADRHLVRHPAFSLYTALMPTRLAPAEFYTQLARVFQITNSADVYKKRGLSHVGRFLKNPKLLVRLFRSIQAVRALTNPETFIGIHRDVQGKRLLPESRVS